MSQRQLRVDIVEAITELVEAKIHYERSRRQIGGEYANSDDVEKAQTRLTDLLLQL